MSELKLNLNPTWENNRFYLHPAEYGLLTKQDVNYLIQTVVRDLVVHKFPEVTYYGSGMASTRLENATGEFMCDLQKRVAALCEAENKRAEQKVMAASSRPVKLVVHKLFSLNFDNKPTVEVVIGLPVIKDTNEVLTELRGEATVLSFRVNWCWGNTADQFDDGKYAAGYRYGSKTWTFDNWDDAIVWAEDTVQKAADAVQANYNEYKIKLGATPHDETDYIELE